MYHVDLAISYTGELLLILWSLLLIIKLGMVKRHNTFEKIEVGKPSEHSYYIFFMFLVQWKGQVDWLFFWLVDKQDNYLSIYRSL